MAGEYLLRAWSVGFFVSDQTADIDNTTPDDFVVDKDAMLNSWGDVPEEWPGCGMCDDEGWCLWDDDQSRYREASFGYWTRKHEPEPCRACNAGEAYSFEEWIDDFVPDRPGEPLKGE